MQHHLLVVICTVLNFLALAFILNKFVKPKFIEGIAKKQESIVRQVEDTESTLEKVSSELEAQRQKLKEVEQEVQQIQQNAHQFAKENSEHIRKNTERELEEWRKRVDLQIEQEFTVLRVGLRNEFINQVIERAGELSVVHLNKEAHINLIEEFVGSLKERK